MSGVSVALSANGLDLTIRDYAVGQKVFRRYTLIRTLGRGGMGVVWLARDNELEREVALKFLPDLIVHDRAVLSDLKRETRRSLELTHKNIVRIYDFVHDEGTGCISMEYIDGDTLSNLRVDRPSKIFEPHELTAWIKQLCEALDYAHNHARVVHRDLKPSNVMVTQRGDLKVADFGIARSLGDSMSMLTMGRVGTSGTLLYMSPQQLHGERGTPLDDIYSLGATIYELLTSKPPFFSGNIDRQIREKIPRPMRDRRIELEIEGQPIDETWEKVVAACLQKEPSSRPQSVAEIPELLALPSGLPRKTRQQMAVPRVKRVPKRRFRRAALWMTGAVSAASKAMPRGAAITVVSAAVVAACVWFFAIRPPPPKRVVEQLLPKMQPSQPPQVQTSATPAESHAAVMLPTEYTYPSDMFKETVVVAPPHLLPALQPATQLVPESTPSPPIEGSLSLETTPAGATVIVDGSITKTSPAIFSNLAVGKHRLQIVLEGYVTENKEVEINEGQATSQETVTLRAREQPQVAATPKAQKDNNRRAKAQAKKSVASKPRQAAATPPPPMVKSALRPTPTPKPSASKDRRRHEFEGSAPGG
jgi:serine/threonine protein kinase